MEHEDLGERRQGNHTPTIALGIAALLLLIVGAMSYRDFVRTSYEKEYAEKERQLLARHGYQVAPFTTNGQQAIQGQPPAYQQAPAQATPNVAPQVAPGTNPPAQTAPAPTNPALAQSAANMQIQRSLPQPIDPEMESIRDSLQQVEEQSRRTEQRFRDITGSIGEEVSSQANAVEEFSEELPDLVVLSGVESLKH